MLNCREISERASDFIDAALPWQVRLEVRLHLMMCRFCREYVRQMALVARALRRLPVGKPLHPARSCWRAFAPNVTDAPAGHGFMNYSALWYFDHFGLLQGLSDQQKQCVEQHTRMVHLKRPGRASPRAACWRAAWAGLTR